jgi:hypothetical protein
MRYKAKSAMIGRAKRKDKESDYPIFIHLFSINDPHKTGHVPEEMLDFPETHKVVIHGLDVIYLPLGNDLLINNLEHIDITTEGPHISISGKQRQ